MKKEGIVNSVQVSHGQLEVVINDRYLGFIDFDEVNWFPMDKDGNEKKGVIAVGTRLRFNDWKSAATRRYTGVEIIIE